jgi:CYTH domain-containing protein
VSAAGEIDRQTLIAAGFLKPDYVKIERERRWLCRETPKNEVINVVAITDIYVTGARLRLREGRPVNGGPPELRLTRKGVVDARTQLITSIYMPEDEFAVLAASLKGARLRKLRHRLKGPRGVTMSYDVFQEALEGLILSEAEFDSPELMAAFPTPDFAVREVTDDARYSGISLALNGLPR